MRYYGKEGAQCDPVYDHATCKREKFRFLCRSVLFGRVPKNAVRWLGVAVLMFAALVAVFNFAPSFTGGQDMHRDLNSTLIIRR